MSKALTLHGIEKAFGDNKVLLGVDLALAGGSTTALVGPSGGGKTVLLKCAAGLERPDAGAIDALGETGVGDWSDLRPRIGGRRWRAPSLAPRIYCCWMIRPPASIRCWRRAWSN